MDSASHDRSTILSRYFSEIRAYSLLTRAEEVTLAKRVLKGDRRSLNELIESNLSFVAKVASEYRNLGLPFEDLLNEGNIGLIEAAHRFDHRKGTKFITYAIWWIRKAILKALSEQSTLVRIPNYQMKKVKEIRDVERILRKQLGRRPKREEICDKMDASMSKVDEIMQFGLKEVSLDDKVGSERGSSISDFLVDKHTTDPEDELIKFESHSLVQGALTYLSEQQQVVITLRFGLHSNKILTLKEIGERMGISRERVRQIEAQAKLRLRKAFARMRAVSAPSKSIYQDQTSPRRSSLKPTL